MGKYFFMSKRFNKQSAQDFGLSDSGNGIAVNPIDGSLWKKDQLYDFGWGAENGYCKMPLPDFSRLFEILLREENDEDVFGAAAIILREYPEELLAQCENMMGTPMRTKDFEKLSRVFHLAQSMNRCPTAGKTYEEILSDSERWKAIADHAAHTGKKDKRFFKRLFGRSEE